MKVVRYIGKLVVFCLLITFLSFGVMILVFQLTNVFFFSVIASLVPLFILLNYGLPWLFKEEVNYFNEKEGEKQNG